MGEDVHPGDGRTNTQGACAVGLGFRLGGRVAIAEPGVELFDPPGNSSRLVERRTGRNARPSGDAAGFPV